MNSAKTYLSIIAGLFFYCTAYSDAIVRLKVSADKHHLVESDGTPVFLMGEAAWTMPENCTREDVDYYLSDRKNRKFNYFQIVAARDLNTEPLAPNSTRTMNPANMYNFMPFEKNADGKADVTRRIAVSGGTPTAPNDYWDHLEYIIQKSKSMNMYVGILPTWNKYYINTKFTASRLFTTDSARDYGYFLGERFGKQYPHIIWLLGGDAYPNEFDVDGVSILRAMAEGLAHGTTGTSVRWDQDSPVWSQVLITTHFGGQSFDFFGSSDHWLKLNGVYLTAPFMYDGAVRSYNYSPVCPALIGESMYEGWVWDGYYRSSRTIRQQLYAAILGGVLGGYAYGSAMSSYEDNPANDQMFRFQSGWKGRLNLEGANDIQHAVNLISSTIAGWWKLQPDPSIVTAGNGTAELIKASSKSSDGSQILVYFPDNSSATVDLRKITTHSRAEAVWYDPRRGITQEGGVFSVAQPLLFSPPRDWMDSVLLLKGSTLMLKSLPVFVEPSFKTVAGEVVLSAENFSYKSGNGGDLGSWGIETETSGYLNAGYMRSSDDKAPGGTHLNFSAGNANLNYVIDFKETGTYYVHLRAYAVDHSENGYFATINGVPINYGGVNPATGLAATFIYTEKTSSWNWYTDGGGTVGRGLRVRFQINAAGKHTFTLYRRDTGSRIDHIWLTKSSIAPQNTATLNLPDTQIFVDAASGGSPPPPPQGLNVK